MQKDIFSIKRHIAGNSKLQTSCYLSFAENVSCAKRTIDAINICAGTNNVIAIMSNFSVEGQKSETERLIVGSLSFEEDVLACTEMSGVFYCQKLDYVYINKRKLFKFKDIDFIKKVIASVMSEGSFDPKFLQNEHQKYQLILQTRLHEPQQLPQQTNDIQCTIL